jgi:hypothetical protein
MKTDTIPSFTIPALVPLVAPWLKQDHYDAKLEAKIVRLINVALHTADFSRLPSDRFFESESREHNLIHVFCYEGQQVIEILPNGQVTAL